MDWREWFDSGEDFIAEYTENNHSYTKYESREEVYQAFKARLIEELNVELNCGLKGKLEERDGK